MTEDRAPELAGAGPTRRIDDWTAFAANYGPFFDGTAFSPDHPQYPHHGPGENTAIADFYTTGSEMWPVPITDSTYGYDADGEGHAYWNGLVDAGGSSLQTFWLESPDVMEAFPAGYAAGTVNVWREFAQYALDHNWTTAEGDDGGGDATLSILMSGDDVPGHGSFDGRIATVRMKGMRFSQQLCELLNLLSSKTGWNRNLAARALSAAYGDNHGFGCDAYGGDEYTQLGITDLYRLQADVIASLEATVKIIYVQKAPGNCNGNAPCENTIQDALGLAVTGVNNIIKVVKDDYAESISLYANCFVQLDCGYDDADYQTKTGVSMVTGLEIGDGEMIVENL